MADKAAQYDRKVDEIRDAGEGSRKAIPGDERAVEIAKDRVREAQDALSPAKYDIPSHIQYCTIPAYAVMHVCKMCPLFFSHCNVVFYNDMHYKAQHPDELCLQ